MINKQTIRRFVPARQRQVIVAALQRVLGPRWKTIVFRHIDQTSLKTLSQTRAFEPELKLVPFFLSKAGATFDIGANVGEYTYVLERTVGPQQTYSIEPVPQLYSKLTRLFPAANVLRVALSDVEGTQSLKIPIVDGNPLWSRSTLERFSEIGETGAVMESVHLQTLDGLCEEINVTDVQFIKIDVEGHEEKVLHGAAKVLARWHPVLLVEIEQRHHAEPIARVFSWIQEQGYSGHFYDVQKMALRPIGDFSIDSNQRIDMLGTTNYINNFFFVREEGAEQMIEAVHQRIRRAAIQ
jgi:FkbM family methyltransferase